MKRDKILLRVPNWIGDAVMTLPALDALKSLYPSSEITILAKPRVTAVFTGNPAVSGTVEYDSSGRHKGFKGRLRLAGELKTMGFSLAVLFQNAFEAALISFLARVPERVGYARDLRSPFLTKAIPCSPQILEVHQTLYYLNIIKELGGETTANPLPKIFISTEEQAKAREYLNGLGIGEGTKLIGASPGASYGPAKMWPADKFAAVLDGYSLETGAVPLLFGGPDDAEASAAVSDELSVKHFNLTGKIGLREFMAIVFGLNAFITNDSGPMHIGAALGVPTVAVFGSTSPELTGPIGPSVSVIQRKIHCVPCFKRECMSGTYDCFSGVTPEDVLASALELSGEMTVGNDA